MNKKIIISIVVLVILIVGSGYVFIFSKDKQESFSASTTKIFSDIKDKFTPYPKCPADLTGILTTPLMDPEKISALIPLGNISPPGHTSPADHIYFATKETGKIPVYAPVDSWITEVTEVSQQNSAGLYVPKGYVLTFTVCDGLILDFANYTELVPALREELVKQSTPECKRDIIKPGHEGGPEGQCYYKLNYPVKGGDILGYTQIDSQGRLPFEIWAYNHNKLARDDIDWAYYDKDNGYPYPRAFCLFDLYTGTLKDQYYSKFGFYDEKNEKAFIPRTIEPRCGQVNQDITGTIQGMWFGDPDKKNKNLEFEGKGLAFIHSNTDPTTAEISIGGNFMNSGVFSFQPIHSGMINREFSEVKADGKIYCYGNPNFDQLKGGEKILVQLLNDRSLNVEHQTGVCSSDESFQKLFTYYR